MATCTADMVDCATRPPALRRGSTVHSPYKMAVLADFAAEFTWCALEILGKLFLAMAFIGEICVYTGLHIYRAVAYTVGLAHYVLTVFIFPLILTLYRVWLYFCEIELLLRRLISLVTYCVVGLGYSMATEAVSIVWWLLSCVLPPVLVGSFRFTVYFVIVPLVQVSADASMVLFDLLETAISKRSVFYDIICAPYTLFTHTNLRAVLLSIGVLVGVLALVVKAALILIAVRLLLSVAFHNREALHLCYQTLCDALLYSRNTVVAMMQYLQQYAVDQLRLQQHVDNVHPNPNNGDAHSGNEADELLCVICVERAKCIVLQPCNHLCLCEECERRLPYRICPICRRRVVRTMRVYVA